MEIKTWWERLNCTRNPGAHSGEDVVRDEEIAELRAAIERQAQEVLKLHRDLAAEKLRADQGWHRYEAANSRKNELEAERANWMQDIAAMKAQQADRVTKDASQLTTQELSDPEYMKAYIEGCNESFAEAMREIVRLRVELFEASQLDIQDQEATPEADAEQLARSKWTVKQWYEHVGAWENAQGEVCFGSMMALGAMLKLMAKARHSAIPVAQQDAKPLCYVRQSDIDSPIGSAIWAYRMAGGEWTVPVHVSIKDQLQ